MPLQFLLGASCVRARVATKCMLPGEYGGSGGGSVCDGDEWER